MFEGVDAYPLSWPVGWARSKSRARAAFADHTLAQARDVILHELFLLGVRGASQVVFSTNVELRRDGLPRSGRRTPDDPGAAVYFILNGQPKVLACDRWTRVEDNLWAIGLHIEAIRGQQRWGVGTVDQAFAGYPALPVPGTNWWEVLKVDKNANEETLRYAYRFAVKRSHPDAGGNQEEFLRIQKAWEQLCKEKGWS